MVRTDLVASKVARTSAWLDDAEPAFARTVEAFGAAQKERDLATFYLFLAVQECIDIAAHWIADEGWTPPDDATATFAVLADRGVLDRAVGDGMRAATGLRNRIAHGYAALDQQRLHADARHGLPLLRRFLLQVSRAAGL